MRNGSPILPLGKINLKTGTSKYFNVYSTWGEDTTYEVWETTSNLDPRKIIHKIVATSGTVPLYKIGDHQSFQHDQTMRYMFQAKMIDFAVGSKLKELSAKYGNSVSGYTYK